MSDQNSASHDNTTIIPLSPQVSQQENEPVGQSETLTKESILLSKSGIVSSVGKKMPIHLRSNSYSFAPNQKNLSIEGTTSKIPRPPIRQLTGPGGLYMSSTDVSQIKLPSTIFEVPTFGSKSSTTFNSDFNTVQVLNIPIGTPVETIKEKISGTLRFIGPTKFKEGYWAGIELDTLGAGKNDGSINGERYFTCPPKTGIFVDCRAIRPRTQQPPKKHNTLPKIKPKLGPVRQKSTTPTPSTNNRLQASRTAQASTGKTKPNPEAKQSGSARSSRNPTPSLGARRASQIDKTGHIRSASKSNSYIANKSSIVNKEVSPPSNVIELVLNNIEDPENDLSEYSNHTSPDPNIVVQNLLSQLNSVRKQNELLQLRINKKKAHNEATRVLRSEFVVKARQEIMNRRVSHSTISDETPNNKAFMEKEERIRELNFRLSQIDIAIQVLKERACDFPVFLENSQNTDDFLKELKLKSMELQQINIDLTDLQAQLSSKEDLLAELKQELDSFSKASNYSLKDDSNASRLTQVLRELDELKKSSTLESNLLKEEIEVLKARQSESSTEANQADSNWKEQCIALKEKLVDLENQLELSNGHLKETESLREDAEIKRLEEISSLEEKLSILSDVNKELEHSLEAMNQNVSSLPIEIKSIQAKYDESLITIENLKAQNEELKQSLLESSKDTSVTDTNRTVSLAEYEELQNEKNEISLSLEAIQLEKESMSVQIKALKSALSQFEHDETSSFDSQRTRIIHDNLQQEIDKLKEHIFHLEEELALSRSIPNNTERDTLFDKNNVYSEQEFDLQKQELVRLKTEVSELRERYQQITQANSDLLMDLKGLEEDNWKMDDLYKEMQDEMERVVAQSNEYKEKVGLLSQALEAASQESDSAQKMREFLLKCDENEALHKAEIDSLYKVLDEQDEEIMFLTENKDVMKKEIEKLNKELSKINKQNTLPKDLLENELDLEGIQALKDDDELFCYLCCETDHESENCPNPPQLDGLDDANLEDFDLTKDFDFGSNPLDSDDVLICDDCQEIGHSYTECPNSTQIF